MEPITIQELMKFTGAALITADGETFKDSAALPEEIAAIKVTDVVIDSRQAKEGSLFVALPGERVDGHNYIQKAFDQGAAVCLSQKEGILPPALKAVLLADDTLKGLGMIGKGYKQKYHPFTVGVTGSIGKTSCKDIVFAALTGKFNTIKTQGNLNSVYGVPLTFFQIGPETQAAVIEMGMDYAGEIDYMAGLAEPEIGIITNVGTAHIEHFADGQTGILHAKMEIASHIENGGALLLNGDDPLLMEAAGDFDFPRVKFFGFSEGCDAKVLYSEHTEDAKLHVIVESRLTKEPEIFDMILPILGRHMALNVAAAILVGELAGETKEQILSGLTHVRLTPHRLQPVETPRYLVIDDAYNAGPASMIGSLETLSLLPGSRRKVAILGDIFELGSFAEEGHAQVGRYAATVPNLDLLICVGKDAAHIASAAREGGMQNVCHFPDLDTLFKNLFTLVQEDDIILIKASHGMEFVRILEVLQNA